jgi:protein tyrosine phosphatase
MELFEAPRPLSQVIEKTKEEIYAEISLLKEIKTKKSYLPVHDYPSPFAE